MDVGMRVDAGGDVPSSGRWSPRCLAATGDVEDPSQPPQETATQNGEEMSKMGTTEAKDAAELETQTRG